MKIPDFFRRGGRKSGGRRVSIAFKSAVLYTLLFGVIVAALVGVMTWSLSERASAYRHLEQVTSFLSDRLAHGDTNFDFDAFARENNISIEIRSDVSGAAPVVYGSMPPPGERRDDQMRRVEKAMGGGTVMLHVVSLEGRSLAGGMSVPVFAVLLGGMLVLAAFLGALLMKRMMRPVREMTRAAREIGASDLSRRLEPGRSRDELGELAETFNGMLDRIESSYRQQQRFVSDASHELRTPLSVISGYANLLRRWGGDDKAVRTEAVDKILEETDNMQQLVERLLFLARSDRGTQPIRPERFRADELMREIAEETRVSDSSHTVEDALEPGVWLTADRALVKQAVRAVVENSQKYTPGGGTIRLGCRRENGGVVLSVADTGCGISENDLPHIFDRFYKTDASRSRGGKSSSGLGLSIVKWIVERHGGEARAQSTPGQGTEISLFLPENPPEDPGAAPKN